MISIPEYINSLIMDAVTTYSTSVNKYLVFDIILKNKSKKLKNAFVKISFAQHP